MNANSKRREMGVFPGVCLEGWGYGPPSRSCQLTFLSKMTPPPSSWMAKGLRRGISGVRAAAVGRAAGRSRWERRGASPARPGRRTPAATAGGAGGAQSMMLANLPSLSAHFIPTPTIQQMATPVAYQVIGAEGSPLAVGRKWNGGGMKGRKIHHKKGLRSLLLEASGDLCRPRRQKATEGRWK